MVGVGLSDVDGEPVGEGDCSSEQEMGTVSTSVLLGHGWHSYAVTLRNWPTGQSWQVQLQGSTMKPRLKLQKSPHAVLPGALLK